jgi:hypothetical protein
MLPSYLFLGLCLFAQSYNPAWTGPEASLAAKSTWEVSTNTDKYLRWWAMAPGESSFRVQRYCKTVGQRTDYHGAHYVLLAREAARQGLIDWPNGVSFDTFKRSNEWRGYKDNLKWHPQEGDAVAFSAFCRLADVYGLDVATAGWKVDPRAYRRGISLLDAPGYRSMDDRRSMEAALNGEIYLHAVKAREKQLRRFVTKAKEILR